MSHQVLLFYKYITIENPEVLASQLRASAQKFSLLGRVIIATEGINATLEGTVENTEKFISELFQDSRFANMHIKHSASEGNTFPKLSVKVRGEIVSTQLSITEADPRVETADHIAPEELHTWYETNKDFVVVDMRNDYEYALGHFENSIDLGLRASRDLPGALTKLETIKDKTILTVCTGGVRCEKMSAYLMHKGFKKVYQLEDGIHGYMEKYPGKNFKGALYTFDGRVVMDFGGEREVVGTCRSCGTQTERYVNCANDACHLHFLVCDLCGAGEKVYCSKQCASVKHCIGTLQ